MARKARAQKDGDGGGSGVSAIRGNGFDPEAVKSFVERIEIKQGEIDEIMTEAKKSCAPHREDMDAIKEEATNAGVPRAELNAVIRKRRLLERAEAVPSKLNDDQKNSFDQLEQALGMFRETPLGGAALARGANGSEGARV